MERTEWLKEMRRKVESLYDHISPLYWVSFGFYENETHRTYLQKFIDRISPGSMVLSAGCGAGRYDGFLLDEGHPVYGIDQSERMLARAREHFPQAYYEKIGLQEMDFHEEFEGVICIDAMEHVCPEDYPVILHKFQKALKPGGVLYYTMDCTPWEALEASYEKARAKGLPVVFGEVADMVDEAYALSLASDQPLPDPIADGAVYHFYPSMKQAYEWINLAGLSVEEEGQGSGYYHFLLKKRNK